MASTTISEMNSGSNCDAISSGGVPDRETLEQLIAGCETPPAIVSNDLSISLTVPVATMQQWFTYDSTCKFSVTVPSSGLTIGSSQLNMDAIVDRLLVPLRESLLYPGEANAFESRPLFDFFLRSIKTRLKTELQTLDVLAAMSANNVTPTINIQNAAGQLVASLADRRRVIVEGAGFLVVGDQIMFLLTLTPNGSTYESSDYRPDLRDGTENAVVITPVSIRVTIQAI
jgi:hypothetical protein